ncbi:MAG: hypothetical protein R6W70_07050 [bacterium]
MKARIKKDLLKPKISFPISKDLYDRYRSITQKAVKMNIEFEFEFEKWLEKEVTDLENFIREHSGDIPNDSDSSENSSSVSGSKPGSGSVTNPKTWRPGEYSKRKKGSAPRKKSSADDDIKIVDEVDGLSESERKRLKEKEKKRLEQQKEDEIKILKGYFSDSDMSDEDIAIELGMPLKEVKSLREELNDI